MVRTRLNREDRKKEILNAGMKVFREKGFIHTTMEDIVEKTTLSKGGVYHYYKSTTDILHDLMYDGLDYRMNIIKNTMTEVYTEEGPDFMAEKIYEKIVDDNPYMEIYVQFLIAKKDSEKLEELFQELKQKNREAFREAFSKLPNAFINDEAYDFITDFINSMIIGSETLKARNVFKNRKDTLITVLKILLKS